MSFTNLDATVIIRVSQSVCLAPHYALTSKYDRTDIFLAFEQPTYRPRPLRLLHSQRHQ